MNLRSLTAYDDFKSCSWEPEILYDLILPPSDYIFKTGDIVILHSLMSSIVPTVEAALAEASLVKAPLGIIGFSMERYGLPTLSLTEHCGPSYSVELERTEHCGPSYSVELESYHDLYKNMNKDTRCIAMETSKRFEIKVSKSSYDKNKRRIQDLGLSSLLKVNFKVDL